MESTDLKYTLVIHGGAGTILRSSMTEDKERAYRSGLENALDAGIAVLKKSGTAMDAVLAACIALEDNELFNAGKGSVFAKDGSQEMDASIMDGKDLSAGAVAAVRNIRNPIQLAHTVMRKSQHVMLIGRGAEEFAKMHGIKQEADEYFYSSFRYKQWEKMQETGEAALDHDVNLNEPTSAKATTGKTKFGTIGAVALDQYGDLAAGTSTGGMTNKEFGRVGDSPIIGAGTYANNKTCAISCTGHGELFIRAVTAYDVSCLMEYKGLSLQDAMKVVVNDKLLKLDGEGGMIGVDAKGNAEMMFNCEGMYRGLIDSNERKVIAIYK